MGSVQRLQNCWCNDIPKSRKQFTQSQLSHHICISLFLFALPVSSVLCLRLHLPSLQNIFTISDHYPFLYPPCPLCHSTASSFVHFFNPWQTFSSTSALFLVFCRAQAGHDLWFLADGLAGELLQHCDDHQTGGGGKSEYSIPTAPSVPPSPCI